MKIMNVRSVAVLAILSGVALAMCACAKSGGTVKGDPKNSTGDNPAQSAPSK